MRERTSAALDRLIGEGLVRLEGNLPRTARRWQSAMARAALRLGGHGSDLEDLRVPIASAMIELHPDASDEELIDLVEAMLPVERYELLPGFFGPEAG